MAPDKGDALFWQHIGKLHRQSDCAEKAGQDLWHARGVAFVTSNFPQ
jgi:hypothetical protein